MKKRFGFFSKILEKWWGKDFVGFLDHNLTKNQHAASAVFGVAV